MPLDLRDLGLTQKEASVFLASLKKGSATANTLSKLTRLPRSTTYDTLNALCAKGFMSSYLFEKRTHYRSAEPRDLVVHLEARARKAQHLLPQLEALKSTAPEKTQVELFEGVNGVVTILEQLYNEKEILLYGSASVASAALKHIPEVLARKRVERKIKLRALFESSRHALFRMEDPDIRKFTSMRFLPYIKELTTNTFIAGKHIVELTLQYEIAGIHIISPELSHTQRVLFEQLWKQGKR